MRIDCTAEKWQATVAYFLDPAIVDKMKSLGLRIRKMDWREKAVYLDADDYADMQRIIASISTLETMSSEKPSPARAVKTCVPSASLSALRCEK